MFLKVEAINVNSITTFGSLDNIVEDKEDRQSSVFNYREFNVAIGSSIDTVFENDTEIPDYVLKVTSSTFSWESDDDTTLVLDSVNFPRGKYYNIKRPI